MGLQCGGSGNVTLPINETVPLGAVGFDTASLGLTVIGNRTSYRPAWSASRVPTSYSRFQASVYVDGASMQFGTATSAADLVQAVSAASPGNDSCCRQGAAAAISEFRMTVPEEQPPGGGPVLHMAVRSPRLAAWLGASSAASSTADNDTFSLLAVAASLARSEFGAGWSAGRLVASSASDQCDAQACRLQPFAQCRQNGSVQLSTAVLPSNESLSAYSSLLLEGQSPSLAWSAAIDPITARPEGADAGVAAIPGGALALGGLVHPSWSGRVRWANRWSSQSGRTLHRFHLHAPRLCGQDLLAGSLPSLQTVMGFPDTGAVCLQLPAEMFDQVAAWVPALNCSAEAQTDPAAAAELGLTPWQRLCTLPGNTSAASLPSIDFAMSPDSAAEWEQWSPPPQQPGSLALPLASLLVRPDDVAQAALASELGLPAGVGGERRLCMLRGYSLASSAVSLGYGAFSSGGVSFGTLALSALGLVVEADPSTRMGLVQREIDPNSPPHRPRWLVTAAVNASGALPAGAGGSCAAAAACGLQQRWDVASNRCLPPECDRYWMQQLAADELSCEYGSKPLVGLGIILGLVLLLEAGAVWVEASVTAAIPRYVPGHAVPFAQRRASHLQTLSFLLTGRPVPAPSGPIDAREPAQAAGDSQGSSGAAAATAAGALGSLEPLAASRRGSGTFEQRPLVSASSDRSVAGEGLEVDRSAAGAAAASGAAADSAAGGGLTGNGAAAIRASAGSVGGVSALSGLRRRRQRASGAEEADEWRAANEVARLLGVMPRPRA